MNEHGGAPAVRHRRILATALIVGVGVVAALSWAAPAMRGKRSKPAPATKPAQVAAAATSTVRGSIDGTRYLPLELGRETRYEVTVAPPIGKSRKATATNKVNEHVELNGKTYYKVMTTITGVPFMPDTLIYYRPALEGIYQVLEGDEESPEWLYLPRSIEIGDRWGAKTPNGDYQFTAVAMEDVETSSGKYPQCLKLSVTMKKTLVTNKQEQWLAPGVGVVKQSDSNAFFSATVVLEEVKQGKLAEDSEQ